MNGDLKQQFSDMVCGLVKPGEEIVKTVTPMQAHRWHMASGIAGEIGELFAGYCQDNSENVLEECGDILFYAEGLLQTLNASIHSIGLPSFLGAGFYKEKEAFVKISVAVSEVVDCVKKEVIYGKPLNVQKLTSALMSTVQVIDWFLYQSDLTRADALQHNFVKLGRRYAGHKYSDEQAIARADKQEETK